MSEKSERVRVKISSFLLALVCGSLLTGLGEVRAAPTSATPDKTDQNRPVNPDDELSVPPEEPAVVKHFTHAQRQAFCQKYDGKLIAYYESVYEVEHCKRRAVTDNKTIYNFLRAGRRIVNVDGDVIAAVPEGRPLDPASLGKPRRGCRQLEGRYVTHSNIDVYFVQKCHKRLFPNWTSYFEHREKRGDHRSEILALSAAEFRALPAGKDMPSIFDDLYASAAHKYADAEIIPIDEACEGVEGRLAAYYSRLYRIEKCHKREIVDPELFLKVLGKKLGLGSREKVVELTSQQWLSLPGGRPITPVKAKASVRPQKPAATR